MALSARGLRLRRAKAAGGPNRWTIGLGILALGTVAALTAAEVGRVWRRGAAPLPADTDDILGAAEIVARETAEVAAESIRQASEKEAAAMNLLVAFVVTSASVRAATHTIRRRGGVGPVHNLQLKGTHVHHFVPGIILMVISGAASVISDDERHDKWLAIPFGAGAAMTLDESALLLELDDVYWTERGVVSIQVTLGAISILAALRLAMRVVRRGEQAVLEEE